MIEWFEWRANRRRGKEIWNGEFVGGVEDEMRWYKDLDKFAQDDKNRIKVICRIKLLQIELFFEK